MSDEVKIGHVTHYFGKIMVAAIELSEAAELMAGAPQATQGSLVTSREMAYFAGLTLIPVALYFGLVAIVFVLAAIFGGGFG